MPMSEYMKGWLLDIDWYTTLRHFAALCGITNEDDIDRFAEEQTQRLVEESSRYKDEQ